MGALPARVERRRGAAGGRVTAADMSAFIADRLAEDEAAANAAKPGRWSVNYHPIHGWRVMDNPEPRNATLVAWLPLSMWREQDSNDSARATLGHIARWQPTRALADIAAKRELLDTVMAWEHDYHDDDTWFSCSQALLPIGQRTDPEDSEPGSGCSDDSRRGQPCDCGLDRRRTAILLPLATIWSDHPAFKPAWRTEA